MQFIASNTSIPVPKVYCAFKDKKWAHVVMERIEGGLLGQGWDYRTEESKARILSQLKEMMNEMRSIPPPKDVKIFNTDGGSLYDLRLLGTSNRFGPFKIVQGFHRHLRNGEEAHPSHPPGVTQLISEHEREWPPLCFTHGDPSSQNILVRGDDVVGILDCRIGKILQLAMSIHRTNFVVKRLTNSPSLCL